MPTVNKILKLAALTFALAMCVSAQDFLPDKGEPKDVRKVY